MIKTSDSNSYHANIFRLHQDEWCYHKNGYKMIVLYKPLTVSQLLIYVVEDIVSKGIKSDEHRRIDDTFYDHIVEYSKRLGVEPYDVSNELNTKWIEMFKSEDFNVFDEKYKKIFLELGDSVRQMVLRCKERI